MAQAQINDISPRSKVARIECEIDRFLHHFRNNSDQSQEILKLYTIFQSTLTSDFRKIIQRNASSNCIVYSTLALTFDELYDPLTFQANRLRIEQQSIYPNGSRFH